ncbi:MAG: sporulation transcriptional regulator SpoIIID [Clostridia bacterium]
MDIFLDERAKELAKFVIENRATVRETARVFGISKSTVHNDLHEKLKAIDIDLYAQAREILDYNLSVRHIRGGESTKKLFNSKK